MKKTLFFTLTLCYVFMSKAQTNSYSNVEGYLEKINLISDISDIQKKQMRAESTENKIKITNSIEQALADWKRISKSYESIPYSLKNDFIAYHFYIDLISPESSVNVDIKQNLIILFKNGAIDSIINGIAESRAEKAGKSRLLKRLDPLIKQQVHNYLVKEVVDILTEKSINYESFIAKNGDVYYEELSVVVEREKENFKKLEKEREIEEIVSKAKNAGLDSIRIKLLVDLIKQKTYDLAEVKRSKNINTGFFEVSNGKDPKEIKRKFAQDISNLITVGEYQIILGDALLPIVDRKVNTQLEEVLEMYELTEDQKLTVSDMMKRFYFKEIVLKYYYSFDRSLSKQKLSGLRYHFEKEYQQLMIDFDVAVKPSTKASNNAYQY